MLNGSMGSVTTGPSPAREGGCVESSAEGSVEARGL